MLEHNYRQHGIAGDFFNEFFYNADVSFIEADDQLGPADTAAKQWLEMLAGNKNNLGDTLMIDLDSHESSEARSFLSPTHVNFALAKVAEHCLDPTFAPNKKGKDGKVIIIAPYGAQRNLYTYELKKRASVEQLTNETWASFDKSCVDVRTHQGVQGYEASVVIVDLTRSDSPGVTGQAQLVETSAAREQSLRSQG